MVRKREVFAAESLADIPVPPSHRHPISGEPIWDAEAVRQLMALQIARQPPSASDRMSDELREFIEGMSVSVDVSTGDHDAGNRLFGTVTEVMDDPASKHGVTLLMHNQEPNFKPPSVDAAEQKPVTDEMVEIASDSYEREALSGKSHEEAWRVALSTALAAARSPAASADDSNAKA